MLRPCLTSSKGAGDSKTRTGTCISEAPWGYKYMCFSQELMIFNVYTTVLYLLLVERNLIPLLTQFMKIICTELPDEAFNSLEMRFLRYVQTTEEKKLKNNKPNMRVGSSRFDASRG